MKKWKSVSTSIPRGDIALIQSYLPEGMTVNQFSGRLLRVLVENPKRIGTMLELIERMEKRVEVEEVLIPKEEYRLE